MGTCADLADPKTDALTSVKCPDFHRSAQLCLPALPCH